ncbi:MAG TPA: hypothetical protein VLK27_13505 [Chthoniobacterales bacterium]|nr:hypothetical protein [Chthoniobacterales bacterium]
MHRTATLVFLALTCLVGCDVDLFGLDWKRLGGGYSLVLDGETNDACAIVAHHQNGGLIVTQIGWRQPLILSRYESDWDVLDTSTGKHTKVSEEQRSSDPAYRDIAVYAARIAWDRLKRHKSLW